MTKDIPPGSVLSDKTIADIASGRYLLVADKPAGPKPRRKSHRH